jgi:hypothetical protein
MSKAVARLEMGRGIARWTGGVPQGSVGLVDGPMARKPDAARR